MDLSFKEAISKRIYQLCDKYNYSANKLAELSAVAPSTLTDMLQCKVSNPSSYIIFKLCKTLKITLEEFFNSELFDFENICD